MKSFKNKIINILILNKQDKYTIKFLIYNKNQVFIKVIYKKWLLMFVSIY